MTNMTLIIFLLALSLLTNILQFIISNSLIKNRNKWRQKYAESHDELKYHYEIHEAEEALENMN